MSNVIKFYPASAADYPDPVLEQAVGDYESVLILGYGTDGALDVRSSNNLTREQILWTIETFKSEILLNVTPDFFET